MSPSPLVGAGVRMSTQTAAMAHYLVTTDVPCLGIPNAWQPTVARALPCVERHAAAHGVPPPADFDEVAAGVLEVHRLPKRPLLGVGDRAFERHAPRPQALDD